MLMNEMKRKLLDRLMEMDGKWRSSNLVVMKFDYREVPLAEQCLIELSERGIIEYRKRPYGLIMVAEYRYAPPPPPRLKVVK